MSHLLEQGYYRVLNRHEQMVATSTMPTFDKSDKTTPAIDIYYPNSIANMHQEFYPLPNPLQGQEIRFLCFAKCQQIIRSLKSG